MRSLGRSMEIRWLGLSWLGLIGMMVVASQAGCVTTPEENLGVARIALTAVPADVNCIRVRAVGVRDVSQNFDVVPGPGTTLFMPGLSTGTVEMSADAFPTACSGAGDVTTANWTSDPATVEITPTAIADVTLVMHRNGRVNVGIDFRDDNCQPNMAGKCLPPPSCKDRMRNQMESDIDCGGPICSPCGDGLRCAVNGDCASGGCVAGRCAVPTCADGVQNGTETDADCGGGVCFPCNGGLHCLVASDCSSGACVNQICESSCSNGAKDGTETDQDCGGGSCPACNNGGDCVVNSDCESLFCERGRCAPTCMDGVQNGTETDVDCGGQCGLCAEGRHCLIDADCGSRMCVANVCSPQQCAFAPGLVSWWRGDNSFADGFGSNDGVGVGTVTFAPGIRNDGFSFDHTFASFVEVAASASLDISGALTIDAWINPSEPTARIVDKIGAFGNDGYLLDLIGGRLRIMTGFDSLVTNDLVPLGTFTHVAGVFDGANLALYINGAPVMTGPATQSLIPVNGLSLKIGADSGGGSMFGGVIDEPRIWNQALNQKDIRNLFLQPSVCP